MNRTRAAVILVAGVGSRLRPITDDKPKCLVEVSGRSILGRAVDALRAYGVRKLVLATGYRQDALERAMSDSPLEVVYRRNPRFDSTQNAVSLALCRDAVEGSAFFKLDGDVLFDPVVLERLDEAGAALSVAVDRGARLDAEAMKVRLSDDGWITAFGKHIRTRDSGGESIGIERIAADAGRELFDALDAAVGAGETSLYYEDIYGRLIDHGLRAAAVDVSALDWCEVDAVEDLERASRLFP